MTACGAYASVRYGCDNNGRFVYRGVLGLVLGAALEVCAVTYINTEDQFAALHDVLDEAEAYDIRVGAARAALAMLERLRAEAKTRAAIYARRDAAMQGKWEFHFVWYPETTPYVEVWRKGSRFGSFAGETPLAALEAALDATGVL